VLHVTHPLNVLLKEHHSAFATLLFNLDYTSPYRYVVRLHNRRIVRGMSFVQLLLIAERHTRSSSVPSYCMILPLYQLKNREPKHGS
jgi:hypothetical protein